MKLASQAINRRNVLRAGTLGAGGLAAAALFGCKGRSGAPASGSAGGSGAPAAGSTKQKFLNEDLLVFNDPKMPFPYIAPEPDRPVKKGGTYTYGWSFDIAAMDPGNSSSVSSGAIPSAVSDYLVEFVHGPRQNPLKTELQPGLARTWEVSPDGLTYTFKLTDKAKFHNKAPVNGRQFTAEDVRLVFERYANTGIARGNFNGVEKMTTVDPRTFQVKMSVPKPDFIWPLGTRQSALYAIEMATADNGKFSGTDQIGTGAFILTEAVRGQHARMTANKDYWQGAPHLDGQEWRIMPDESARLAAFRAGRLDASDSIVRDVKSAEALIASNPGTVITLTPALRGGSVIDINMKSSKFKDERIRQALSLSYNRERHVQVLSDGLGVPYVQVIPWIFTFDKPPTQQEVGPWVRYDVAEAKKLMAAAGAENFTFEVLRSATYTSDSELAFQLEAFKGIGVNVQAKSVDVTAWNSQWQTSTFPDTVSKGINTGSVVADGFFRDQLETGGGQNRINLSDPQIDDWAKLQSQEMDPKKRRDIQRKIWDRMGQMVPRVDAPGSVGFAARQGWLRGSSVSSPFNGICTCAAGQMMRPVWLDK